MTGGATSFSAGFILVFQLDIQIYIALNMEFFMLFNMGLDGSYLDN